MWYIYRLPWWLRWESVCLQCGRPGFDPWVGKILWRRQWQPTPGQLPGKSHGWKSLVGYSPWGSQRVRHDWATSLLIFHQMDITYLIETVTQWRLSLVLPLYTISPNSSCRAIRGVRVTGPRISSCLAIEWTEERAPSSSVGMSEWTQFPTGPNCGFFLEAWIWI